MVYDKELDDELKRLGKSQISYALMRNKMNEVDALIKEGHNFNPKEEPYLLAKATNDQHTEGVLKLLQNGYDPNYQDEAGRAALHDVKDVPTAMVLLEHGANPNIKDAYGNNPLHRDMGALGGDVAMTLIEAGADVLATNVVGWSPLEMVRRWSDAVESASLVTVLETQTIKAVINNALSDVGPNEWKKEADEDREKRQERMHQDQGFVEAEHREERRTNRRRM